MRGRSRSRTPRVTPWASSATHPGVGAGMSRGRRRLRRHVGEWRGSGRGAEPRPMTCAEPIARYHDISSVPLVCRVRFGALAAVLAVSEVHHVHLVSPSVPGIRRDTRAGRMMATVVRGLWPPYSAS